VETQFQSIPDGGEDFGRVAYCPEWVPDLFDFAVGADQKTAADNSLEQAAMIFSRATRLGSISVLGR